VERAHLRRNTAIVPSAVPPRSSGAKIADRYPCFNAICRPRGTAPPPLPGRDVDRPALERTGADDALRIERTGPLSAPTLV
jgi:hypothetical protein